jgi:DNA end-binding protein Ku
MRQKQYLAAIRPYGRGLAMSTMLFADEVVAQSDVDGIPARKPATSPKERKMAGDIVDSLTTDWDPKRYHDDYEEQLRAIIKAKSKGETIEAPETEAAAPVLDLMEALRASLDEPGARRTKRRPKQATRAKPARKATRAKKAGRTKQTGRARAARRSA